MSLLHAPTCTRWLDALERRLIFAPPEMQPRPLRNALRRAQDSEVWISFRSAITQAPAVLHGEWHAHRHADAPALLFLHGARSDLGHSIDRIHHLQELGFGVLAIDYRGFGKSGRELPSEAMACEDAHAAWQWLARHQPTKARYVFGHSLGGAIAIDLAADVSDASGLIVDSSFTCLADVVQHFNWGWPPVLRRITQRFDAIRKIASVRAPVLVVHGDEDRLIPPALGQALCDSATAPKRFVLVRGGSHHDTHAKGHGPYRQALQELFGLPV
ncbi:alpha/beta hydrolase [Sphaerotilaceae bacterium SBD11-9]